MEFELTPFDQAPTPGQAVELLQENEPPQGYFGCFSGGKDSVVIKELARLAGVKVEWHYHKTTFDAPEIIKYLKEHHQDVIFDRPKHGNFFNRMLDMGFPTRRNKWCCKEYKEGKFPPGAVVLMGIRSEESPMRGNRWGVKSFHWRTGNVVICPIYNWASDEVWRFIKETGVPYCSLYDEGRSRLGCIGCPSARAGRIEQFKRWPQFERKWKRSFRLIWEKRTGTMPRGKPWFGDVYFDNWQEMWDWWLYDRPLPNKGQTSFDLEIEGS
jgi:phosphoadenosine phosphosulfate reductase